MSKVGFVWWLTQDGRAGRPGDIRTWKEGETYTTLFQAFGHIKRGTSEELEVWKVEILQTSPYTIRLLRRIKTAGPGE